MRLPHSCRLRFPWNSLLAVIVAFVPAGAHAEDLQTKDGHVYKNVVLTGEETDRVKVRHADGSGWINKKDLPAEFANAHGIRLSTAAAREVEDTARTEKLLAKFKSLFAEIHTTDARAYPSKEIVALETTSLKLQREGGIERVKLADLVAEQREALQFDAEKARQADDEAKRLQAAAKGAEEAKLFAQTSARTHVMYAHARVVQKVADGYICSVWQITPPMANPSLEDLVKLAGAVPDRDPSRGEIIQESTFALLYSPGLQDFIVVRNHVFPVRVLVASLPPQVLETHTYRGPLFIVGKYGFDGANDTPGQIPLAFPTAVGAEDFVARRGLGSYLRDDMAPKPPAPLEEERTRPTRAIRK